MSDATPETYILSIPGTDQTEELPRATVLARMAKGEITPGHWVWSPPDQDWKQISEIPSLQAAVPVTLPSPVPAAATKKASLLGQLGKKKTAPAAVAPAPAATKRKVVRPRREKKERQSGDFSILGFLGALLLLAMAAVVALNYEFIDKPFDGNLAQTPFVLVQTHMHLGAFVQPDKLVIHVLPIVEIKSDNLPNVIHILPNPELHSDNFADFLFSLAKSTPPPPFGWKPFSVIEITPGLKGQYAMEGPDWQKLAQMEKDSSDERKQFLLDHLDDSSGHPLVNTKNLDPEAAKTAQDAVWTEVLASFQVSGS